MTPASNNARAHDLGRDIPVLAHSLRTHGQRKPIVAKKQYRGEPDVVIAGNGTLAAAKLLGWDTIAVSWFEGTDHEAQEYALMDNRTAELSEWDLGELASQMREVRDRGSDITLLGWLPHEAEPLLRAEWDEQPQETRNAYAKSLSFTLDQWIHIEQAVARMRAREDDDEMSNSRVLELIAADFIAGPE